jgi:hypothetical protein
MNGMADELATQQREAMKGPKLEVDGNFCHIVIKDRCITRESQKWLLEMFGKVPIQKYYYDKYKWTQATFDDINWGKTIYGVLPNSATDGCQPTTGFSEKRCRPINVAPSATT